jgi:hypothetical protein
MRHPDGTLDSYAHTDNVLADLDRQQYQLQEGPCYDATTDHRYALASNLGADARYPHYGPIAVRAGIRSQAGIRLFENTRTAGGLNLYSRQVGALDHILTLTQLFSHQAAVALAYSLEVTTLKEAVKSRTRIGQAVGIVMERYKVPEHQAFAFLTRMSQTRNTKIRHIADQLIEAVPAGMAPPRPPTGVVDRSLG